MSKVKNENLLFEKLDVDAKDVKIKSRGRVSGGSYYESVMRDFNDSKEECMVVKYKGETNKLSGVRATLRKIAIANKFPIKTDVGELKDGTKVLVFSKVKEPPEYHPRSEKSKSKK